MWVFTQPYFKYINHLKAREKVLRLNWHVNVLWLDNQSISEDWYCFLEMQLFKKKNNVVSKATSFLSFYFVAFLAVGII